MIRLILAILAILNKSLTDFRMKNETGVIENKSMTNQDRM